MVDCSECPVIEIEDAIGQAAGLSDAARAESFAMIAVLVEREWDGDGSRTLADWISCRVPASTKTARRWVRNHLAAGDDASGAPQLTSGSAISMETLERLGCDGRIQALIASAAGELIASSAVQRTVHPGHAVHRPGVGRSTRHLAGRTATA